MASIKVGLPYCPEKDHPIPGLRKQPGGLFPIFCESKIGFLQILNIVSKQLMQRVEFNSLKHRNLRQEFLFWMCIVSFIL